MSEVNRELAIAEILEFSRQEAAGGVCSVRVLETINTLSNIELNSPQIGTLIGPDDSYVEQTYQPLKTELTTLRPSGKLVVLPSDSPDTTRVAWMHKPTGNLLELWQLVERPFQADCSFAIFVPAMDNQLDIDYSTIVTVSDESKPTSNEDLVWDTARTNASVLDALIRYLKHSDEYEPGAPTLDEAIKLEELVDAYDLTQSRKRNAANPLNLAYAPPDALARQIERLANWAAMSNDTGVKKIARLSVRDEVTVGVTNTGVVSVSTHHLDLGRAGRVIENGLLHLKDGEIVCTDDTPHKEAMLRELVEGALGIPEIIADDLLQQQITDVVSNNSSPKTIQNEVDRLLCSFRKKHRMSDSQIIDMGVIDLTHVDASQDTILFYNFRGVKATVLAHQGLDLFSGSYSLYECHVVGARSAFGCLGGNAPSAGLIRCSTDGVGDAFNRSRASKECIAINGESAFCDSHDAISCITDNVEEAFIITSATDSIARNALRAFNSVNDSRRVGCIAEHCGTSFKGGRTSAKSSNEALNPRLFGINFDLLSRKRMRGNKISGRIVGKNGIKLRGKYS